MVQVYGGYFWMGALGVASITQLLAIFGIANEINLMVWIYGLEMAGGFLSFISMIVMWYAYDSAYAITVDSSKDAAEQAQAANVMSGIWMDFVKGTLNSIITEGALMMASEPWYRWNMNMAGYEMEDNKDHYHDGDYEGDYEGDNDWDDWDDWEMDEEMMAKMIKFFSF